MEMSTQERQLCEFLKSQPRVHRNRYTEKAENALLQNLFWSLAGGRKDYLDLFFPDNSKPLSNATWKLRKAQGGADGDEFTEAARGKACGHIFKSGEATYRCKTCSADETCVLCSHCYDSSDHTGHMVYIAVSLGNSGCCDCGDPEAWRLPVHCSIHTADQNASQGADKGKGAGLPPDLVESIRMTIGRVFDYICDVISCSPEQLRLPKTKEGIRLDEQMSRLTSDYYNGDVIEDPCEYAIMLWNDEKHTVTEVRDMVARACRTTTQDGMKRAHETDEIGRSIVKYGFDLDEMLQVSKKIEEIKVTVTIRSSRDTFREQMCGTIIEWLSDIAGCSVGSDHSILRQTVCEEMLKPWSLGSLAYNREVGMHGIDDHAKSEDEEITMSHRSILVRQRIEMMRAARLAAEDVEVSEDDEDDEEEDLDRDEMAIPGFFDIDEDDSASETEEIETIEGPIFVTRRGVRAGAATVTFDVDGDIDMGDSPQEESEATNAGYPPPPPPPPPPPAPNLQPPPPPPAPLRPRDRDLTPSDSDTAEAQPLISSSVYAKARLEIPKTPGGKVQSKEATRPPRYWLETPKSFDNQEAPAPYEDLLQRLRLDWMILFDLRLWKKVRVDLRDLYISTVVTIPEFKRVLGLRFAGLYTTLAQLYLIADREPDHSIINISLQMLTTPSITAEIVERGNFLTNLMAILYTFLTTRQVGHPHEILPDATLAFDSGSVTNRRMYHFFIDLRYLFAAEHVQEKLRTDDRYMMQFLDLVKLHQGICPNTRAVGEHVEYETDAWISASLITQQINRLCRQFAEAFKWNVTDDHTYIAKAIRLAAKNTVINSLGIERKRFAQAEIKEEIKFKRVGDYEFDTTDRGNSLLQHSVVKFVVDGQPISFHHALHYTLSWLIECGKGMPREQLVQLLSFTAAELKEKPRGMGSQNFSINNYTPEDHMIAVFDYPLRVCAWLAQMKAGIWVRNGMSLRHQHNTYRGVNQRDVSHHRDIFLLQTAMVVCPPARILVSIIDRYGLEHWMKGIYEQKADGLEDSQVLDVVEDMIHLLIVLICDRTSLVSNEQEPSPHVLAMRRDIAHVLCFKPLSFSDITNKLPERFQEQEECQEILDEMTTFKPPEGLSDVGTFELREHFLEEVDPYISHYNKNQREESENSYKAWMAKKTGRNPADVVFEAKLRPIESGIFKDLSGFTRTGIFAQIIYYALLYPLNSERLTPNVPATRVDAFLQVVLHLVLIAISEDKTDEDEMSEESLDSFVYIALTRSARSNFIDKAPASRTITAVLEMLSRKEEYKACHPKIALVLKRMKQKRPVNFETAFTRLGVPVDRISTASPANNNILEEQEKKKQAGRDRAAKVMAQFQQQQKNFMDNQGDIDWGDDLDSGEDMDAETEPEDHKTYWPYPSGTCILCQEDTKDGGLYGTFGLMMESNILRQTDFSDPDFVREVANSSPNLDASAEATRPAGVSGENREKVHKITASGVEIVTERQFIGKGYPHGKCRPGTISVGCGHIMHYKCFEVYYEASTRRHQHQIARHHPEVLGLNEFVCPLCKALGNTFLPIIWSPKEEKTFGPGQSTEAYDAWISTAVGDKAHDRPKLDVKVPGRDLPTVEVFMKHNREVINHSLASKMSELLMDAWEPTPNLASIPPFLAPNMQNAAPNIPGMWADDPVSGNQAPRAPSPMTELAKIYRRLRDTMRKNNLPTRHNDDQGLPNPSNVDDDLYASDTLAEALGYSISAVEIQHRGIASPHDKTFLDTLPQQAIAHLRVLAESAASYVSVGGIRNAGDNRVTGEFCEDYDRLYRLLFLRSPYGPGDERELHDYGIAGDTLLGKDTFVFLTECSLCLAPVDNIDIMHLVRLCYLAELVKVVMKMDRNRGNSKYLEWISFDQSNDQDDLAPFARFCRNVKMSDTKDGNLHEDEPCSTAMEQPCFNSLESCRVFVKKYALAFLRKVTLLLNVRYGITFSNHIASYPDADELSRLTEALHLPTFDEMCHSATYPYGASYPQLSRLVDGWIEHCNMGPTPLSLSHPVIFELIGLPKNYDTLMEETMKRRCPTTGKDVSDPALCLFCGEIFCGQAICCLKGTTVGGRRVDIGGAQQHMMKCQGNIGLFIFIRKCCVYYNHHQSGSWMVAPYIDRYGEVDPGLRHSRQLFLNQKRYDALLRTVWLSHGVPSIISRKLEMDINNGGWETI